MQSKLIKNIIQWDVRSWSEALAWWDRSVDWTQVDSCLELGGREGGLSLWLALKGKSVVCSDLEKAVLTARPLHQKYKVGALISYQDMDATNIPYENHFDIIIFKSIIGGISRNGDKALQQKVFQQIHKALKPGGRLLFAENLVASPLHRRVRKLFVKWQRYWQYVSVPDLKQYLSCFSAIDLRTTGLLATFGRSERQRCILAIADKIIFNRISPSRWKYIAYGIAIK